MRWSERQRAMLREMGLRLFEAPQGQAPREAEDRPAPAQAAVGAAEMAPAQMVPAKAAPTEVTPTEMAPAELRVAVPVVASSAVAAVAVPGSAAAAVAGMDWPALREAVASCRACALCETRRHTVFGVGHERAHWMIVGEAPGEQEDLRGEPFVGAAGQLLDQMLAALGLTRSEAPPERQVFIANTLKCRPPRNRNPQAEELARCEPFLQRQVALVQPRIILAMGRFAVQSLLRSDEPVGRLRGRVHDYQGVPLVVTYHPAYLLRNLVDKARAWDDLCLAAEVAERRAAAPA